MSKPKQQQVCVQCHHIGNGEIVGHFFIELCAWIIFFPVGLMYTIWRRNNMNANCPACKGVKTMIPSDTPRGREILAGKAVA